MGFFWVPFTSGSVVFVDRDRIEKNNFVGNRCEKNVPNQKAALAII